MRTHIYQQEISGEVEIVVKEAEGHTYYGVAFILKSAEALHDTADDDDRSKVVFWTSETADGINPTQLAGVFRSAAWKLTRHLPSALATGENGRPVFNFKAPE